jgi:hypothetical protein
VDPVFVTKRRLLDPQELNLYAYTRNDPLGFIDPDGRYFVGTDGKRVKIKIKKGQITVGENASDDLKRMAASISASGSKTALKMFKKVAGNDTKVNFKIVSEKVEPTNQLGLHQAHDKNRKALEWNAEKGHFEGDAAYIKGAKGNNIYQEATIIIFEGNISQGRTQEETEGEMVSTFAHEGDHNTNQKTINAIKDRREGIKNDFDVEDPAYEIGRQVTREIAEKKRKKK